MGNFIKKLIVISVIVCMFPINVVQAVEEKTVSENETSQNATDEKYNYALDLDKINYLEYREQHKNKKPAGAEIILPLDGYEVSSNANVENKQNYKGNGIDALVWSNDLGEITWKFNVEKEGFYNIALKYIAIEGKGGEVERGLKINGDYPFKEAINISFKRVWKNRDEQFKEDNNGNQIRPTQVEELMWRDETLKDQYGLYVEPYNIYLKAGENELTLVGIKEAFAIGEIKLFNEESPKTFAEVKAQYEKNAYKSATQSIKIEGELADYKSTPTLYPQVERNDSYTKPFKLGVTKFNNIGGANWKTNGQWISWKFNVEEAGLYKLAFRFKQDYLLGIPSSRKILIDGKSPFMEAEAVEFDYSTDWQLETLKDSNNEDVYVYLTKGEHEITLENTLGNMSEKIQAIQFASEDMLDLYGKMIMITGSSPDTYRDYQLEVRIPGIAETIDDISNRITEQIEIIKSEATGASDVQGLERVAKQLKEMAAKPYTISQRLSTFVDGQGTLSAWVQSMKEQPLNIDFIEFMPLDAKLGDATPSMVERLGTSIKSFLLTFVNDYSQIGNTYDENEAIDVWAAVGKDQADTLKAMIDDDFTEKTGIKVNFNILSTESTLLFAAASGGGPDIALNVSSTLPVDYGVRGALQDLSELDGFEKIYSRFKPTSFVPMTYENKVYGVPMTQSFPVMFYRKDILQKIGVEIPTTWEEVLDVVATLQEHNLEFGAGSNGTQGTVLNTALFDTILMQNGGKYYSEDNSKCILDSKEGIKAFQTFVELYSDYGLPLYYEFYNRFRKGEMPIGIIDYSTYNQLVIAAPELKGMWDIAPVPGTIQADGTIKRTVAGTCTSTVMFENSDKKEDAFKFIEWWTSTETQVRYGRELEAIMGAGARYNTANVDAIEHFPWSANEYKVLSEQLNHVQNIPVIPGSYYTSRHLNNAFREVESLNELPRDSLIKYVEEINKEILKKREEFGLD